MPANSITERIPLLGDPVKLQELLDKHLGGTRAVAKELGCSPHVIANRADKFGLRRHYGRTDPSFAQRQRRAEELFGPSLAGQLDGIARWPGFRKQREHIWRKYRGVSKVIDLTDLHVPYQDIDRVKEALARDGDADVAVIGGDMFHFEALSPFKVKIPIPIEREWTEGVRLVEHLTEMLPVVMILANHENRLAKAIGTLPLPALELLADKTPTLVQLLRGAIRGGKQENARFDGIAHWWVAIGDAVIAHADHFSQIHGRSVTNVADYFRVQKGKIWPRHPIRVVVQGHTHHQADIRYQGVKCIETGCLCRDQDWVHAGKMGAEKKETWQVGYAVLELKDGRADWNKCRYVALDQ